MVLRGSLAHMHHFKFVNWRIGALVFWCHEQVKDLFLLVKTWVKILNLFFVNTCGEQLNIMHNFVFAGVVNIDLTISLVVSVITYICLINYCGTLRKYVLTTKSIVHTWKKVKFTYLEKATKFCEILLL